MSKNKSPTLTIRSSAEDSFIRKFRITAADGKRYSQDRRFESDFDKKIKAIEQKITKRDGGGDA